MTAAAGHCRHGGVTVAAARGGDDGRRLPSRATCSASSTATSRSSATTWWRWPRTVLDRMLGSGGELVTLVTGVGRRRRRSPRRSPTHARARPAGRRHRALRRAASRATRCSSGSSEPWSRCEAPVKTVVGEPDGQGAHDKLGVATVGDLLRHYPRRYYERGELTDLAPAACPASMATVQATVALGVRPADPAQAAQARRRHHRRPHAGSPSPSSTSAGASKDAARRARRSSSPARSRSSATASR